MRTVGVVPVRAIERIESIYDPIISRDPPLQVSVGFLSSRAIENLLETRLVLDADQLHAVGYGLSELLLVDDLGVRPLSVPHRLPGVSVYPRWGEVYYAGPRVGVEGQVKRYVVVSDDRWNATQVSAIAVRTTTQNKRWGDAFPLIEGGGARACCGDATVLPHNLFDLRNRPRPAYLSLDDMASVARGLRDVFDLDDDDPVTRRMET